MVKPAANVKDILTENLDFSVYEEESCPGIYGFETVYGPSRPNEIGYLEGHFGDAETLAECEQLEYIRSFEGRVAYIEEFFVRPSRRSRGIGSQILKRTLGNLWVK